MVQPWRRALPRAATMSSPFSPGVVRAARLSPTPATSLSCTPSDALCLALPLSLALSHHSPLHHPCSYLVFLTRRKGTATGRADRARHACPRRALLVLDQGRTRGRARALPQIRVQGRVGVPPARRWVAACLAVSRAGAGADGAARFVARNASRTFLEEVGPAAASTAAVAELDEPGQAGDAAQHASPVARRARVVAVLAGAVAGLGGGSAGKLGGRAGGDGGALAIAGDRWSLGHELSRRVAA